MIRSHDAHSDSCAREAQEERAERLPCFPLWLCGYMVSRRSMAAMAGVELVARAHSVDDPTRLEDRRALYGCERDSARVHRTPKVPGVAGSNRTGDSAESDHDR